jgi:hypothetical protein
VTAAELRDLQQRIKFDAPTMASCLGIPYQTFRNYIYGANAIPAGVERAALALEVFERECDAARAADGVAAIELQFPHGIPSEVCDKTCEG